MSEIKNDLTTEHDIYISIGLKHPMKPTDCRDLIDSLIVDNFTLSSWGTHTKDEWIDVVNECQEKVDFLNSQVESLKAITELAEKENERLKVIIFKLNPNEEFPLTIDEQIITTELWDGHHE